MKEKDVTEKADNSSVDSEGENLVSWCTPEQMEAMKRAIREGTKRKIERVLSGEFTRDIRELRRGPYMACPGVGGPPDKEFERQIITCPGVGGPPDDEDEGLFTSQDFDPLDEDDL